MTLVVLDTHAVQWLAAEPHRLSRPAMAAVSAADSLAVSAISWYELAWLAHLGKISVVMPIRSWLDDLARDIRTLGVTPAIADTAAQLPSSFPGDPADRLIFATAVEHGARLITKDRRLRDHRHPRPVTIW